MKITLITGFTSYSGYTFEKKVSQQLTEDINKFAYDENSKGIFKNLEKKK